MRQAFNNVKFLGVDEKFIGVSLGYDFCAEHEWGTKDLASKLKIRKSEAMGIESRRIHIDESNAKNIVFKTYENFALLKTIDTWNLERDQEKSFGEQLWPYHESDLKPQVDWKSKEPINEFLKTAWDEGDFLIFVKGDENVKNLKTLYEELLKSNVGMGFLKDMPAFGGSALSLFIIDRLPKEATDQMYRVDRDSKDLINYEEEIGVRKLKDKVNEENRGNRNSHPIHYYMACSPRWIGPSGLTKNLTKEEVEDRAERKKSNWNNTKYDIIFWINYSDDDNNFGWYTAEEIIQWLSTPGLKLTQIRKAH